jgi:hypothetical protein
MFKRSRPVMIAETSPENGEDGSTLVFCSEACGDLWATREMGVLDRHVELPEAASLPLRFGECVYCAECGFNLLPGQECSMHGRECPEWDWKARSFFMMSLMTQLSYTGYSPKRLSDSDWQALDRAVAQVPSITSFELVCLLLLH